MSKRTLYVSLLAAASLAGCGTYRTAEEACRNADPASHVRRGSEEIDVASGSLEPKGREARCVNGIEVETEKASGRGGWAPDQ